MAYRVIRVLDGMASIASDDGTFFNVPINELDFEPKIGDYVQCFRNGDQIVVLKAEENPTPTPTGFYAVINHEGDNFEFDVTLGFGSDECDRSRPVRCIKD